MSHVFNKLGQSVLPKVFAALENSGLVETMTVYTEVLSSDSGGGMRKTSSPVVAENDALVYGGDSLLYSGDQITTGSGGFTYSDIPVAYKAGTGTKILEGEKTVSAVTYLLTFPTHSAAGLRYDIDPISHRLVVSSRGSEPSKTFRILSVADRNGVVYDALCVKEN